MSVIVGCDFSGCGRTAPVDSWSSGRKDLATGEQSINAVLPEDWVVQMASNGLDEVIRCDEHAGR